MLKETLILKHHGKQFIPDVTEAVVPSPFRGRPVITKTKIDEQRLLALCPTAAISINPVAINLGKCAFCGECAFAFPEKISFTNDHKISTNDPENLIIREGENKPITINPLLIRSEISKLFNRSLKLRQISAGGDNSAELELNACGNPNFDMIRFGIEFVASPRHADGIVITGPISRNMAEAVKICYDAVPEPKLVILAGVDAISGGIFAESKAIDRTFLRDMHIDLFIPGNPPHPLNIINGLLELTREYFFKRRYEKIKLSL